MRRRPLSWYAMLSGALGLLLTTADPLPAAEKKGPAGPLSLIVMDPLAEPLSCPCVAGYAQRRYERLAEYLERRLQRTVRIGFGESLTKALQGAAEGRADLIIGKDSVVRADAQAANLKVTAVARLTGKDGSATQTGLLVVPRRDPAKRVSDLKGYRILFGPADCAEKHAAALELLRAEGVPLPAKLEISQACSDGACRILEFPPGARGAAVISSYAKPLLEGCGTVKKGELRVVGETKPVPFITAIVDRTLPARDRRRITEALLAVGSQPALCAALESLLGFVPVEEPRTAETPPPAGPGRGQRPQPPAEWTGWRGSQRDGWCPSLPAALPAQRQIMWTQKLAGPGLGGIAATQRYVILGDRDLEDRADVFRCFDAPTGLPLWTVQYPAAGRLDYGNTPRATPLIHGDLVYLHGAFGDVHCVQLDTGAIVWKKNLRQEFGVTTKMVWGFCSSPLVADGRLIVNPGGRPASLAALDLKTGAVLWKTPGGEAGFGSLIAATLGGVPQIVGHERKSLGGWDVRTGARLWTLVPPVAGDFNVPTPIAVDGQLLVTTENNGTRLYAFDSQGRIRPEPVACNEDLAPDISTPVVVNNRVYCVWNELYCLDLKAALKEVYRGEDEAFGAYAAVVGGPDRVLVIGAGGRLVLIDAGTKEYRVVSRRAVLDSGDAEVYAHPALVGDRLYLRGETALVCEDLGAGR